MQSNLDAHMLQTSTQVLPKVILSKWFANFNKFGKLRFFPHILQLFTKILRGWQNFEMVTSHKVMLCPTHQKDF